VKGFCRIYPRTGEKFLENVDPLPQVQRSSGILATEGDAARISRQSLLLPAFFGNIQSIREAEWQHADFKAKFKNLS